MTAGETAIFNWSSHDLPHFRLIAFGGVVCRKPGAGLLRGEHMKTLTRDKARHQPGYNRRRRNERQQKLRIAGVPQIEDSHLLDGNEAPGPDEEAELAKIIAAACEQFRVNHQPAPERVTVVEEVDCDE